jgi:hypothetical protein
VLWGCQPKFYRFSYPRENRPVSSSFVPSTEYSLPNSPAPEIALYNVAAESGRSRPGVVCFVATELDAAVDDSGPKVLKRESFGEVEYEIIATPTIDRDKFKKLFDAISRNTPGVTPTFVPCEFLLNSVDLPGTLSGVRASFSSYCSTAGDLFWFIRLRASVSLSKQLESFMKSPTGLLVPTKATLGGVNLPITPPFEVRVSAPVREEVSRVRTSPK